MSEIPTAGEMLQTIPQPKPMQTGDLRIGTVTALFAMVLTAKVKFDGETDASEKEYAYLASYSPTVNDRVLLARVGGTWVILGKVAYHVAPSGGGGNVFVGDVSVGGDLEIDGYLNHDGARIGFFGTTPVIKQVVADPSAITAATAPASYSQTWGGQVRTDLVNLQAKLKAVCDAMQAYGMM